LGLRVLQANGTRDVLIVDEYTKVGGNHLDVAIGPYTFDVGSFIFQNDSPLLRWFPDLMQYYVSIDPTWSRLNPQGLITDYPFSIRDDVLRQGPIVFMQMVGSLIASRVSSKPINDAGAFAQFWLGKKLTERSGLLYYMERLYGVPAEQIDLQFAESRMGWIPANAKISTHVQRGLAVLRPGSTSGHQSKNTQLARPRAGFADLYSPVADSLQKAGASFRLGRRPDGLRHEQRGFVLTVGDEEISAKEVVSTIPVHLALAIAGIESQPLPTVTLVTLFYSFRGIRGFKSSMLYNFTASAAWKRLTVYSDFYEEVGGREYFAVEVVARSEDISVERANEEFRAHAADHGLWRGDLRLEGGHVLRNAYPIFTKGSADRAAGYISKLREFGVKSLGRQGGFEYQSTARVSTRVVESTFGILPVEVPPQPVQGKDPSTQ
jgi:hypothetical protein